MNHSQPSDPEPAAGMNMESLLALNEPVFLSAISDEGDNRLRAVLCIGGHRPLPRKILGKDAEEAARTPIEFTDAPYCELRWGRYFLFSVRDEGSASFRRDEVFRGTVVRRFTKSWFLDNVGSLSNGTLGLRGKVAHLGLYCINHIVDVLAYEDPQVVDLGRRTMKPRMSNPTPDPEPAPGIPPAGQEPRRG